MIKDYNFYGYDIKVDDSLEKVTLEEEIAGGIMAELSLGHHNTALNVRKVDDKFAVNAEVNNFGITKPGANDDPEKFGVSVLDELEDKLLHSILPFTVDYDNSQVVDPRVNNGKLQALVVLNYTEPQDEKDQEIEKLKAKISKLEHPEFEADASVESEDK